MIQRTANRLRVTASMVMVNARALLDAGGAAFQGSQEVVDLAGVAEADSSALAVMLGWLRAARKQKVRLVFANVPAGILSLAELYGVHELLPLA